MSNKTELTATDKMVIDLAIHAKSKLTDKHDMELTISFFFVMQEILVPKIFNDYQFNMLIIFFKKGANDIKDLERILLASDAYEHFKNSYEKIMFK